METLTPTPPTPAATEIPTPAPPSTVAQITEVAAPAEKASLFSNKMEFLEIGLLSLVAASYIMSILYYRKAIEASNSYQKLQAQINQIKISLNQTNA